MKIVYYGMSFQEHSGTILKGEEKTDLGRISKEQASGNIICKNTIYMEKVDKLVSIASYQTNSFCSGQMDGS